MEYYQTCYNRGWLGLNSMRMPWKMISFFFFVLRIVSSEDQGTWGIYTLKPEGLRLSITLRVYYFSGWVFWSLLGQHGLLMFWTIDHLGRLMCLLAILSLWSIWKLWGTRESAVCSITWAISVTMTALLVGHMGVCVHPCNKYLFTNVGVWQAWWEK